MIFPCFSMREPLPRCLPTRRCLASVHAVTGGRAPAPSTAASLNAADDRDGDANRARPLLAARRGDRAACVRRARWRPNAPAPTGSSRWSESRMGSAPPHLARGRKGHGRTWEWLLGEKDGGQRDAKQLSLMTVLKYWMRSCNRSLFLRN
jgi:hypothetical protein